MEGTSNLKEPNPTYMYVGAAWLIESAFMWSKMSLFHLLSSCVEIPPPELTFAGFIL